jgi:hypothetical protein
VSHCQQSLTFAIPVVCPSNLAAVAGLTAPVPWSLAWRDDGELAPQDLLDLLQILVASETAEVQPALIVAVERLPVEELTALASGEVTRLCA